MLKFACAMLMRSNGSRVQASSKASVITLSNWFSLVFNLISFGRYFSSVRFLIFASLPCSGGGVIRNTFHRSVITIGTPVSRNLSSTLYTSSRNFEEVISILNLPAYCIPMVQYKRQNVRDQEHIVRFVCLILERRPRKTCSGDDVTYATDDPWIRNQSSSYPRGRRVFN